MPALIPPTDLRPVLSSAVRALPLFSWLLLAACGGGGAPAAGGGAPPPSEVGVVTVAAQSVPLQAELPGRTEASRIAQVRARVAGVLLRQQFREGSDVKAGQPLFQIDDAPLRATLASAQASVAKAEASLMQTRALADRYQPLAAANAISQQELVAAQAAAKQAEADLAAGRAAVQVAQINVGYAAVAAPIGGRIGRALVTEGALVGQGEATPLAVVQQIDPLYVNFTQPAAEALRLRAAIQAGRLQRAGRDAAVVKVLLEDGSVYPLPGKLLFSDLSVDSGTGQVTLRAEVPNPKGDLLPGLFVRVQLEQAQVAGAFVLPQQAVQPNAQGYTVMVVGADGKVAPRPVKVGPGVGSRWVVTDGLKAGEQVVVDGFQKIRPNVPVKPVPWAPPGAAAVPAGASAAASAAPAASR